MIKDIAAKAYSNEATVLNSYYIANSTCDLQGDIVECGVAAGAQVAAMYRGCPNKKIWLFDSFEGIPLAGEHDTSQPGIGEFNHDVKGNLLISSGITVHGINEVRNNFKNWGVNDSDFNYVIGWFENTIPVNNIEKIAVLRLDGDLYNSTKVCLEWLFPKVVKGGWVIIDDYGLDGCKKATDEYFINNESFKDFKVVEGTEKVIYFQIK